MKGPPTDSFNFACFLILGHMFHCLLEVQQSGMVEIFSQLFYLAIKVFIYLSITFPITSSWGLIYQCIEQISESLSNFPVMFIHTCITTFHYLEPSLTTNGKQIIKFMRSRIMQFCLLIAVLTVQPSACIQWMLNGYLLLG